MHNTYVLPGVVDEAVVRKQAENRYREDHELTTIHHHRYLASCVEECYLWPVQSD